MAGRFELAADPRARTRSSPHKAENPRTRNPQWRAVGTTLPILEFACLLFATANLAPWRAPTPTFAITLVPHLASKPMGE